MAGLISGLVDAGLLGSAEAKQRLREASWDQILPAIHRGIITSGITILYQGAYSPTRRGSQRDPGSRQDAARLTRSILQLTGVGPAGRPGPHP